MQAKKPSSYCGKQSLKIYPSSLSIFLLALIVSLTAAADQEPFLIGTEHYPPYEMETPINHLRGFDYEVLVKIFQLLNIEISIQFYPWKRAISYARSGRILGILTCAHSKEREAFINYSDPISEFVDGYYLRSNFTGKKITRISDFIGTKVGSVNEYESYKELQTIGANPISAKTTLHAIRMLDKSRFDYLVLGQQATDFIIKSEGLVDKFTFTALNKQHFYFCFSRNNPQSRALVAPFNNALKQLKSSGEYKMIHDKYR